MARRYVTLRVWHPGCWMLELTERNPGVSVTCDAASAWNGRVVAEAVVNADSRESLDHALATSPGADVQREVLHRGADFAEVYSEYPCARSLLQDVQDAGFLLVGPVRHEAGQERWEVLADAATLPDGIARLREHAEVVVERVSDRRAAATTPDAGLAARIGASISPRQLQILERAVRAGYYRWPRGRKAKQIAHELGISGPTCLEHIRRAEGRIVPAILDDLLRSKDRRARP